MLDSLKRDWSFNLSEGATIEPTSATKWDYVHTKSFQSLSRLATCGLDHELSVVSFKVPREAVGFLSMRYKRMLD
jgi:hypothetical protein